ncbi:MAG: ATP-binding domain-containing protein [Myxococcota bacterium]|nr:ATP-binding domain-containing protein [Myxococcota bacterium]
MTAEGLTTPGEASDDAERDRIVAEEERVLARVLRSIEARRAERRRADVDYDAQLLALRDQINEARLEDVPPLIEEMERLQQVAARRAKVSEGLVDPASPYFGRMVLAENDRRREVLIGRATYLDPRTGTRIVDWRDAPVSRIYYRYAEGDPYEETFGGRDVEGEVVTRRALAIAGGQLRRIGAPQGTFVRTLDGRWRRVGVSAARLSGGQGAAMRAEAHHRPGSRPTRLGTGEGSDREEKYLPEIAALIDPRQFELITRPDSGIVVIQGGAGSGKTTIGLHRLAYLAFQQPSRFRADRMLVLVFNDALARYISRVLPALGVPDVLVTTFERWAHRLRVEQLPRLPARYSDETPSSVVRLKKHPAMLRLLDEYCAELEARADRRLRAAAGDGAEGQAALAGWQAQAGRPLAQRLETLLQWLDRRDESQARRLPVALRHVIERAAQASQREVRDVIGIWADLLTDRKRIAEGLARHAPGQFDAEEIDEAVRWCARQASRLSTWFEEEEGARAQNARAARPTDDDELDEERERAESYERSARSVEEAGSDGDVDAESDEDEYDHGVDGQQERPAATLDVEDDALLLGLVQRLWGPLQRRGEPVRYEHVFVDEAQDLSPVELSVVLGACTPARSLTLAGDVAQRLLMNNGFSGWRPLFEALGLGAIEIEPLRLTYRSTAEIMELANEVLGPLRPDVQSNATRHGAPVELFRFAHPGDAVAFLAEALRELVRLEPRASVALIARHAEQADLYYRGLEQAEIPNLRRIADQDFPFRPGVDVTDVRQVKGLEFDYVVLLEVSAASYPVDDESRHLLHIAATRAAHQLWITTSGPPSELLPEALRARAY